MGGHPKEKLAGGTNKALEPPPGFITVFLTFTFYGSSLSQGFHMAETTAETHTFWQSYK